MVQVAVREVIIQSLLSNSDRPCNLVCKKGSFNLYFMLFKTSCCVFRKSMASRTAESKIVLDGIRWPIKACKCRCLVYICFTHFLQLWLLLPPLGSNGIVPDVCEAKDTDLVFWLSLTSFETIMLFSDMIEIESCQRLTWISIKICVSCLVRGFCILQCNFPSMWMWIVTTRNHEDCPNLWIKVYMKSVQQQIVEKTLWLQYNYNCTGESRCNTILGHPSFFRNIRENLSGGVDLSSLSCLISDESREAKQCDHTHQKQKIGGVYWEHRCLVWISHPPLRFGWNILVLLDPCVLDVVE